MQSRLVVLVVACALTGVGCGGNSSSDPAPPADASTPQVSEAPDVTVSDSVPDALLPHAIPPDTEASASATLPLSDDGVSLVGASGAEGWSWGPVAVDGRGDVWVSGPMSLMRLDPATGTSRLWDAADVGALASITAMDGDPDAGVWMVNSRQVSMFGGDEIRVDTTVPDGIGRDWPATNIAAGIRDDVYVSFVGGGISRWVDGGWTAISTSRGGALDVDANGVLWSGGDPHPVASVREVGIGRYDGDAWQDLSADDGAPIAAVVDIASDGAGGVWVLADGELHHWYDGDWATTDTSSLGEVGSVTVTGDGSLWAAVPSGIGRLDPQDRWTVFDDAGNAPGAVTGDDSRLESGDDTLIVRGESGVVRWNGTGFVPMWEPPTTEPTEAGTLVAVDREEAWVYAASADGSRGWWLFRAGSWHPRGPHVVEEVYTSGGVLATDGAFWGYTADGIVRFTDEAWTVMGPDGTFSRAVAAGPDGLVWTVEDDDADDATPGIVVGITPDGQRIVAGRVADDVPVEPHFLGVAPDGTLWAGVGGYGPPRLSRWDGTTWTAVDVPDGTEQIWDMAIAGDGSLWISRFEPDTVEAPTPLQRYADGQWAAVDWERPGGLDLAVTPSGRVCASSPTVVCYSPDGAQQQQLDPPALWGSLSIAADGTAWLMAAQVVRLPDPIT